MKFVLALGSGAFFFLVALAAASAESDASSASGTTASDDFSSLRTGAQVYAAACATCHGSDGRGASGSTLGFDIPLPDFTDCVFASREPRGDWFSIAHDGGPTRAFNPMMPAFGEALWRGLGAEGAPDDWADVPRFLPTGSAIGDLGLAYLAAIESALAGAAEG